MSYSNYNEKQIIRERIRALRQSLTPEKIRTAGESVSRIVHVRVSEIKPGTICVYASTGKEIPTGDLMRDLIDGGYRVAVPDWEAWKQGSGLRIVSIESPDELVLEGRIVPQPTVIDGRICPIEEVELFLVPGIAFDNQGNRLGMGGGYFDRLLSNASPAATFTGLAYNFQIITRLPTDPHDIAVHEVVTPGGIHVGGVKNKQEGRNYVV